MIILCLNCGSSSVKYRLYDWNKKQTIATGIVERVTSKGSFCIQEVTGQDSVRVESECPTHREAIKLIIEMLTSLKEGVIKELMGISAVGHRVVHGGERFAKSVIITDEVVEEFKKLADLAPLHNLPNILGIEAAKELLPNVPHMAIMDTAWHQTMPKYVFTYALPYEWYEKYKIRRYGFHGTSLLYVSRRASVLLGKDPFECNLIICHIGNGVSLNAVKNGISFDTSMGFTPLEGLVMGTRAGDHDAAIDFYIMDKENYSANEMNSILNKKSGILGITGEYNDRREVIEAAERGDERAKLALDIETYRIRKYIGAYAAAIGGIDAIVFTAGVGEMCDLIRARALDGLDFMGIKYDKNKNKIAKTRNAECDISAEDSKVKIYVIPTDEERVFIEDVVALYEKSRGNKVRYTYRFQSPYYRNSLRDREFEKECEKNPELHKVVAKVN
ncbi:acetate kinase [bacterium]|nr:acetate kinase [bacterium]